MMDVTVSEFLAKNSPKIAYKTVYFSEIRLECVHSDGIGNGVHSFPITETTTVRQLCEKNCPKGFEQKITKILDGNIVSIVPQDTNVLELINDGHEYRINQISRGIALTDDSFFICLSFMGNNQKNRLPILVEVSNGESLTALSFRLMNILKLNINTKHLETFKFDADRKWICVTKDKNEILVAPSDKSNEIPLISLLSDI